MPLALFSTVLNASLISLRALRFFAAGACVRSAIGSGFPAAAPH